jgi:hypothetical protein
MNTQNLRDLAVLISLSMSSYSPRTLDREESRKLTQHKGAQAGSAKVIRDRLAGTKAADVLAQITAAQGEARATLYKSSLPWDDSGRRMCNNETAHDLIIDLRGKEAHITDLAGKFAEAWKTAGTEAQAALNGLWKADDYAASPDQMRAKFSMKIDIEPIPQAADLRMDVPGDILAEIRKQTEARITARFNAGCQDAYKRLYDVIDAMHKKLTDPEAIFRDSLVGNVRDMIDLLPVLNIGKDPKLNDLAETARKRLLTLELPATLAGMPETTPGTELLARKLRDEPEHRRQTAAAASRILADISQYMGAPQ